MATVTHYIYSHYDPPKLNNEEITDDTAEKEEEDPWITESTFGARRRIQNPPRFVPAAVSYDEVNNMIGGASSSVPCEPEPPQSTDVGDWYRSLRRALSAPVADSLASPRSNGYSVDSPSVLSSQALPVPALPSIPLVRAGNDWFSSRAVLSEPVSAPTLADILSREPPPERKDQPFVPPVFLHIGPSNRGFTMLQQSGWSEGEALGAGAARRTRLQKARKKKPARTVLDDPRYSVKTEEREIALDGSDDIREVRKVEVVDLTLSDSDDDEFEALAGPGTTSLPPSSAASHNPTALLTPIATVLKSDRLGIGLKAKTVGPFKKSKKRVTHNQAALAAHVRANEDMRIRKALLGRGANSFARIAKAEAENRKRLLANLNAD
ncbi:hypothetical protein TRAPUB_9601 [Trametes pubescens]|uniref:G-patch domain-containing protein n=1 Tax=Trametes pubescens TaxID=154538 RepID=A0A1M2W1U4_TRAPU|nr:hypothetical protein TRAPUB_9601 [Trametes pubescens]